MRVSFALGLALALGALSLAPYLLAYAWAPPGRHFMGFFFIADDATTYLAKMQQGASGAWLWTDPYTSEPHHGVFLFGFYLLFGHLSALLHIPLIGGYHLARVSGAIALVLAVDRIAARLLPLALRRLAVVIAVLGSGLGFVVQALGNPSVGGQPLQALDLHLPELSGWYSILAIPHFAWATALICAGLLGLLRMEETRSWRGVALTGLSLTALAAIHPQMVAVLGLVWLAYRLLLLAWGYHPAWSSYLLELGAFAITAPLIAYNAWILYRDPTIAQWAHQWRHQAPDPVSLCISLGLPLLASLPGMVITWRRRDRGMGLMLVWPMLVFALLYLPNVANIQRRLLDAVYVPIGLLAAVGLRAVLGRLPRPRAVRLERVVLAAACLSSGLVLAIAFRFASGAFAESGLPDGDWQALRAMSIDHRAGDRALSSPGIGLYLPAWSGVNVYVGHYSETLDYFQKIRLASSLLQGGVSPDTLQSFLKTNGITLLYWGPQERRLLGFDPDQAPFLQIAYRNGSVSIYRVTEAR